MTTQDVKWKSKFLKDHTDVYYLFSICMSMGDPYFKNRIFKIL